MLICKVAFAFQNHSKTLVVWICHVLFCGCVDLSCVRNVTNTAVLNTADLTNTMIKNQDYGAELLSVYASHR